jgi:hypothetical protein
MPPRFAFSSKFRAPAHGSRPLRLSALVRVGMLLCLAVVALVLSAASSAHAQLPLDSKATKTGAGTISASALSKTVARPMWSELNLSQQLALQPLAETWDGLSLGHKRKWLAIIRNYPKMTPEDQTVMHSRMTGWATLSQQQRVQARLNFAEVKQLPADERKAKWAAYQALSDEKKRELADQADANAPRGAAIPAKSMSAQKFAPVPVPVGDRLPRIQLAPPEEPLVPPIRKTRPASMGAPIPAEAQVLVPAALIEQAPSQSSTAP